MKDDRNENNLSLRRCRYVEDWEVCQKGFTGMTTCNKN